MGKSVSFELNSAGVRELLQSPEMGAIIQNAAEQVAAKAESLSGGLAFDVSTGTGSTRVWGAVRPGSIHAYHKTRRDNILEKAKRGVKI